MESRIDAEERKRMVAEAAYFRAERRGFEGGDPLADWVEAEAEIDAALNAQSGALQVQSTALYEHQSEPRERHAEAREHGAAESRADDASAQRHGAPGRRHLGSGEASKRRRDEPRGAEAHAQQPADARADAAQATDGEPQEKLHDELLARIEDGVAEAAKKVEALRKKAGDAETTVRAEVQQQLDRIAELRDALETRRNEIRQQGAQASRSLLEQAESLWKELTAFVSRKAPVSRKRNSRRK